MILNKFYTCFKESLRISSADNLDYYPKFAITLTALSMIDAEVGVLRDLSTVGSLQGRNPGRRQ